MKVGIDIDTDTKDSPLVKALRTVGEMIIGTTFTEPGNADIVITDAPSKCLHYLKQGKHVVQFVFWHHIQRAEGLETAPAYQGRFEIFKLIKDDQYGDCIEMFAHISAIIKKEEA